MPDPSISRLTLGDLAHRALAASEPGARLPLVSQLARGTHSPEQLSAVADLFLGVRTAAGWRVFLEWIARVRAALPESVVARVVLLLSKRQVPVSVRVAAAARTLRWVPDTLESVRPITRRLTARLSPARGLDRLRHLQHQVDRCHTLDLLIERRELRVKMGCPRCGIRLPKPEMVKHLWHEHGVFLEAGKVRTPRRVVDELKLEQTVTRDTTLLDRVTVMADPAALRAWSAESDPIAEDVAPIRLEAERHGKGLCPTCLSDLPPGVRPLPPPLVLRKGRVAGDGYVVKVGGAQWLRTLTVSGPGRLIRSGPDRRRGLGPRGAASLAAMPIVLGALAASILLPQVVAPFLIVIWSLVVAVVVYGFVLAVRKPLPPADDRAIDAAWTVLARRLIGTDGATRFLTRLCRSSLGHGDYLERVGVLNRVLDRARREAEKSDDGMQLLAVIEVLLVEDGTRLGRDRVAGVAALAAAGFRGEQPTDYAEYVVECYLTRERSVAELSRLRILLLDKALDSGLRTRDLIDLWAVAPNLRRAMAVEPLHRMALLSGVWGLRNTRPWNRIGPADTVFELARVAPNLSGRVLSEHPDLLLYHQPEHHIQSELGPVLVCGRGVVVAGVMVADPDADVRVVRSGRFGGGWELVYGTHRIRLARKPPATFVAQLRYWLSFRATVLLPYIDDYRHPGAREVYERVLSPFSRRCRHCGSVSVVAVGRVGTLIRAGRGSPG